MEFNDIYEQYNKFVFYSCRKFTNDDELALDAMQEVFIKLYESMDTIRNMESIKSWLYICAKNISLNMMRKVKRIHKNEESANGETGGQIDVEGDYIDREREELIGQALSGMDIKYETALRMRYILEYTPKEIAKILKLPQATVYTRLKRGERILREIINKYDASEQEGRT